MKALYVNPYTDFGFKKLFAYEEQEAGLKALYINPYTDFGFKKLFAYEE